MKNLIKQIQKKSTPLGKSYWNNDAVYSAELDKLSDELVPNSGDSTTVHGELVRVIQRFVHEWGCNGNGNAVEMSKMTCESCGGSGYDEPDDDDDEYQADCSNCGGECTVDEYVELDSYYERMMRFLDSYVINKDVIERFEKYLLSFNTYYEMNEKNAERIYDELCDEVMFQVLTTENEPNPDFEKEDI